MTKMKEEFIKAYGSIDECESKDWWLEHLGIWNHAWSVALEPYKKKFLRKVSEKYPEEVKRVLEEGW